MLLEELGILDAGWFLWNLMLSFTFFIGIFLIVSKEAIECLNRDFQKEFGWRKNIATQLESKKFVFIDMFVLKYSVWIGLLISVISFVLLLMYKNQMCI